jgi:hypothetical protein
MVALMPICASDSWIRIAIGSLIVALPRSNDSWVSKPAAAPASAISCRAFARFVP